jgi:DTW domain-containing protein YfiP
VIVVQHPRERGMPIGTAHMARLCLPNAELHVGVRVAEMPGLQRALADTSRPIGLLYPDPGARDIIADPPAGPVTLVLVDGTWAHARKLVRDNPELASLPRYAFRPPAPSEYRIRKEPSEEYVSTIESLALVLGALEGDPDKFKALLIPFRAMVDAQIACAHSLGKRLTNRRPRAPRVLPTDVLHRREGELVCVVGEANTWPHDTPQRQVPGYRSELVHWLAIRMATGERFEAVVRPAGPLAPRTAEIAGLAPEAIAAGIDGPALGSAFNKDFLREGELVCAWGPHVLELYAGMTGMPLADTVDLRAIASAMNRGRVGRLEEYADASGRVGPALGQGRGGQRLAEVVAALEHLRSLDDDDDEDNEDAEESAVIEA